MQLVMIALVRIVLLVVLAGMVGACGQGAGPPVVPQRIADYGTTVTPSPSTDQCGRPVEQRTGGWFCYER